LCSVQSFWAFGHDFSWANLPKAITIGGKVNLFFFTGGQEQLQIEKGNFKHKPFPPILDE
jgi:hypothetical protein